MRRYFLVAGIFTATFVGLGVTDAFISPQPAGAFVANADGLAKAVTTTNTIIEVKHKTPPGWHHCRKVGWRGGSRPPGHQ
jgi:hypothetical protein